ncbi:MAG TPA: hypothetical protein VFF68_11870 [Anaerolineaceae bacterium]|nr:hypothetical protein [Anaerolineaceae bacterium]
MDQTNEPRRPEGTEPEPDETGPLTPEPEALSPEAESGVQSFEAPPHEEVSMEEPVPETPFPAPEPAPVAPPPPRRRTGTWILLSLLLALLLFGGGYALAYFTRYQPAAEQMRELQASSAETQTQLDQTGEQLAQRESELEVSRETAAAAEAALAESQNQALLNGLQNDVLVARLALANEDLLTARQALRLAESDLEELRAISPDEGMVDDLAARLEDARSAMGEDPDAAGVELRLLSDNIVLLQEQFR